ncbi:MAG: hypothetical protein EOO27_04845 [Comamonadaceae bacterium]|nr:MAG: hypothetical protein EOO27_04845 [Comamonadaceae bacterium]
MTDPVRSPLDYLAKLEVVAVSLKKCPHCHGMNDIIPSQAPPGLGVFRFAVEHHHEPDCPVHEDNIVISSDD